MLVEDDDVDVVGDDAEERENGADENVVDDFDNSANILVQELVPCLFVMLSASFVERNDYHFVL